MTTEQATKELTEALAKCGEGKSAVKGALVYGLDSLEAVSTKGFSHPNILRMMDIDR